MAVPHEQKRRQNRARYFRSGGCPVKTPTTVWERCSIFADNMQRSSVYVRKNAITVTLERAGPPFVDVLKKERP
jgi:hypothetical protein